MSLFSSQLRVFLVAAVFRLVLLVYGGWQDANSAVKYTDIDYMVFTDAARYVANGKPPYARDTYRYTPLLAWMLLPTAWESSAPSALTFAFGKILFALADVLAGWLVVQLLCRCYHFPTDRALRYVSAIWLWNPMVANISTRGSAEGLLGVLVAALLWATLTRRPVLAGGILSLAVHFKIYPFIYGVSMIWWWDAERDGSVSTSAESGWVARAIAFITPSRVKLTLSALVTFATLNLVMYLQYGMPFVQHTFFHHLTRIDHRHNFSPYSTLLYLSAAGGANSHFEALAFLPQLILAVMALPLVLAKKCLASAMLAQTFAFVTFNKVCTSQYFLWYLILLPFYLPSSSLMRKPAVGISAAVLWVAAQALWLHQGYNLEFLGRSAFVPGLFLAALFFFAVNVWILGIIIRDAGECTGEIVGGDKNHQPKTMTET